MQPSCAEFIEHEFRRCIEQTIRRLKDEDTHRPFHAALLSEDALFWSRFERSFSTSFGQRVIEQISKAAAMSGGAEEAETQRATPVVLSLAQLSAIEEHIKNLRNHSSGRVASWQHDIHELASVLPSADEQRLRVISDLWWKKDGIDHFMSIKTVKPNIDQTAEARRDLLKLKLAYPNAKVYYGLYYNPYGENKADYAWGPPRKLFNFSSDESVLIGREYWDTLGGDGFYDELLQIAQKVGRETRAKIEALR